MHKRVLTLYSRSGCHLCEDMKYEIEALAQSEGLEIREVDVDSDPELVRRYGSRVPVLVANGAEICHYMLDMSALKAYLEQNP